MSGMLGNFLSSVAPDASQIAATAVQDFAGSNTSPPPAAPAAAIPVAQPGQPVVVQPGAPVFVPGAAANPIVPVAPAPQGVVAKLKALPLPTKLLIGGGVAAALYALSHRR